VPFIVVKFAGQEIARRELNAAVVIGRAPDCEVAIRDILLSRRHCRLALSDDGWTLQDLQSKNGTIINGEKLCVPRLLNDNDVVRLGRSKIIFRTGVPEDDIAEDLMAPARPANPGDSLAGTLSGFSLLLPGEGETPDDMPCPQPRPRDPPAYDHEELQSLLTAIASSSWDSVYAEARQPLRAVESDMTGEEDDAPRRRVRPSSPTDFSLQANPVVTPVADPPKPPKKNRRIRAPLHLMVSAIWVGFLGLLMTNQKPLAGGATARPAYAPPPVETKLQLDHAALKKAAAVATGVYFDLP
jgi:predicted component of type VI protein secretion system